MKLKKFLTVFVSLLTVVSMLFSTAVTASADKGDRGRSPSKTHSYIRNNSQENDNDQGNNNNNPNNDQGNNNNNPSNDQGNNNANNDQGGQQQEQSQNTTANKISLYSDIPSYLGSGNDECTIHFLLIDSDEANGSMSNVTHSKNSSYTLPDCIYKAAEGFAFDGYIVCDDDQGEKKYKAGDVITIGDQSHLYIWCHFKRGADQNRTVVHFTYGYGDPCTGTMGDIVVEKGKDFKAPKCTLTAKKGYVFDHWVLDKEYKAGDTINAGNADEVYVWAIFVKKGEQTVEVTFDNNLSGNKHRSYTENLKYDYNENTMTEGYGKITLPEPDFDTLKGYKFKKWNVGKPGDTYYTDVSEKVTIYAVMERESVNISDCSVELYYSAYLNTLKKVVTTPICTVKDKYGNDLTINEDFKVEYLNISAPNGQTKIKLTGINGVTGTKTGSYKLRLKKQEITKASMSNGKLEVNFLPTDECYYKVTIQVSESSGFASDKTLSFTKTSSSGATSCKIELDDDWKNVKKYIRVRYKAVGGYNAPWSDVKTVNP